MALKNIKKMWISTSGFLMTNQHYVEGWDGDAYLTAATDHQQSWEIQEMLKRTYGFRSQFTVVDGNVYQFRRSGRLQFVEQLYTNIIWVKRSFGAEPMTIGDHVRRQKNSRHEKDFEKGYAE